MQAGIDVKLPEGFVVEPEVLDGFKATAKEMGLDSPKAQKLFDQYVALEQRRADAAAKEFAARDAKWAAELKADPAFSPQKSAETVKTLRRAIDHLGGKELADAIMSAGLGNHPVLVRGLLKLGNGLREDSVAGTTPAAGDKGAETPLKFLMYPTMKSKP